MYEHDLSNLFRNVEYQYDVFISYSSAQESEARAVYELLRPEMSVFFAPETLNALNYEPGQYVQVLSDSLTQSCQALVLLSSNFLESSWCQLEMYGYFNLLLDEEHRSLWVAILEEGIDRQIGGQFVPLLSSRDEAVERVRRRFSEAALRVGDRFAEREPPKMFIDLPLYELYEPPSASNRPPWGKDSRSPHGVPGAPPFQIYEKMVREYMVQLSRRRAGKEFDPYAPEEEDELVLSIPMMGVGEQYQYMKAAARRDAEEMLRLGFLGHSGSGGGRLDGRYMFARSVQARLRGAAHEELDLDEAFGRICMGQLDMINQLEQVIQRNEKSTLSNFYKVELAKAKYLAKDYDGALAVLEPLKIKHGAKLVNDACMARLGKLPDTEREANARSEVRIDDVRMRSSMEDRDQLDFWAEGLELAGYRR